MLAEFLKTEITIVRQAEAFTAPLRYWKRHGGQIPPPICGNAFCVTLSNGRIQIECVWDESRPAYECGLDDYLHAVNAYVAGA